MRGNHINFRKVADGVIVYFLFLPRGCFSSRTPGFILEADGGLSSSLLNLVKVQAG